MSFRSLLSGLVGLWGMVAGGGETTSAAPGLGEVKKTAEALLANNCVRENLRGSETQQVMMAAIGNNRHQIG